MTAPETDDLGEKITRLLSSPDGMQKIQSVMAALSGGEASPPPSAPAPSSSTPAPSTPALDIGGLPDVAALTRLMPLLGSLNKEDDDTRLLQALRPYLHGEREQRLDEAVKLLRLSRMLPLIQAQGLFGSAGNTGKGGDGRGG